MDSGGGGGRSKAASDEKPPPEATSGNHPHLCFHKSLRAVLLFVSVTLSCLVLYHSSYPFQFFPKSYHLAASSSMVTHSSSPVKDEDELETVLKRAAMVNKTVIITTLNEAWIAPNSIFDLFLESFRIGNGTSWCLNHLVVIALDQKAYDRCLELHPHCYFLTTEGIDFSSEANFMTSEYLKMMWRRIDFLRGVLERGYNFIFTDTDIMWFRNPFQRFYLDSDFQIACDAFKGNPWDLNNAPNGGFNYVKSNNQTIQFYKFWYNSRMTYPGLHDQDVLNKIKRNLYLKEIGLRIKFLDTKFFGGFCQPSKDLNLVCTMHANCCVGLDNKVHDLRIILNNWQEYISSSANRSILQPPSWTVPQHCGMQSFRHRDPPKKNDKQGNNRRLRL